MKNESDFARNLMMICRGRNLSLSEFSEMLEVPKTTLRAVMRGRNISLFTAIRIADKLKMPLSILTGEVGEDVRALDALTQYFAWVEPRAELEDGAVLKHTRTIMNVIQRRASISPPLQDEQTAR